MTIRDATPGDAAVIAAIWNPAIRDSAITFTSSEKTKAGIKAMIAERQADGHAFVVALRKERIVGFATYAQFRGGIGYRRTMEHSVFLEPDMRGRGQGRGLMAAIERHARAGQVHSLIAGISSGNPQAIRFHAALGFEDVGVLREAGCKFDRWFDLHLMQKRL